MSVTQLEGILEILQVEDRGHDGLGLGRMSAASLIKLLLLLPLVLFYLLPVLLLLTAFLFCSLLEGRQGLEPKWRQLFPRPCGGSRGAATKPAKDLGCRSLRLTTWLNPRVFVPAQRASE
jgi:hypothetical protein